MMTSNNALIPDPDKEDVLASKPFDWPFLHLGLRMCGWGDHQLKYYLLGNPVVWWGSTTSLFAGILVFGIYVLRMQRKYVDMEPSEFVSRWQRTRLMIFFFCNRRMGSFLVCRQDCALWLGTPFWCEIFLFLIDFCSSDLLQRHS
jgi:dolichyl-phosphate-mannose--protein O-mannosyl transferase